MARDWRRWQGWRGQVTYWKGWLAFHVFMAVPAWVSLSKLQWLLPSAGDYAHWDEAIAAMRSDLEAPTKETLVGGN